MSAGKIQCDCGCGEEEFLNRMRTIEVETALDETLRRTQVTKRFLVRAECHDPFVHELQAMKVLNDYVRRHARSPIWIRFWYMRRVIRMQHVSNLRLKGLEATRRMSIRSGLLFVAPIRLTLLPQIPRLGFKGVGIPVQGWLDHYWRWSDGCRHRKAARAAARGLKVISSDGSQKEV